MSSRGLHWGLLGLLCFVRVTQACLTTGLYMGAILLWSHGVNITCGVSHMESQYKLSEHEPQTSLPCS